MFLDYPAFVIDPNSLIDDHLFLVPATFGGIAGLLICTTASIAGLSIIWLIMRSWQTDVKFVASLACLCPVVVLIFGVFELTFFYVSIDFAITAVMLGWIMSTANRSQCAQTYDCGTDIVTKFPDNRDGELATIERLGIRFRTNSSRFVILVLRAGVFIVVTVIPAIMLKWVSQDRLGARLDGSVISWSTIWVIALVIGLTAFSFASLYERKDRAQQVAVVAFLCAFAIMIFNLATEFDSDLPGYIDVLGLILTLPIFILGTLSLILTVVLDNQRRTWPFWVCYLFIYIFVHSMAGSGYVKNVTKLDLFSWGNMSVIVFVFLFAIPAYFASDRCQRQTLATTSHEPNR